MTFKMTKKQQKQFAELLKKQAAKKGTTVEDLKQDAGLDTLYSTEGAMYEAMAVYNFFKSRVEPRLEPKEDPKKFDARYREWRFKVCDGCGDKFAYAYHYEGVKFCSLDCLEGALRKIGITFTRHRDLKRRWGPTAYPAIVPSTALKALKEQYPSLSPSVFDSENSDLPKNHVRSDPRLSIPSEQDNQSNIA